LELFHGVPEFLFKNYAICRPTANEVPLKCCWATLDQPLSQSFTRQLDIWDILDLCSGDYDGNFYRMQLHIV
jgi:hypothetical protein